MKSAIPLLLTVAVWATGNLVRAEEVASGYPLVMAFTIPPFEEEATVAGIDGWKLISSGKPEFAIVRTHSDSKPGLLLRTYGIERLLDEKLAGEVTITAVVKFGYVAEVGSRSSFTFMPMVNVGVGSAPFGFDNDPASALNPGGFFYSVRAPGDDGSTVLKKVNLLPREAAFEGAKYTLSMDMNLSARTFVLTITGTGQDGQPVKVDSGEVSMEAPESPATGEQFLTGIRMASSLSGSAELFVESITIAPRTN